MNSLFFLVSLLFFLSGCTEDMPSGDGHYPSGKKHKIVLSVDDPMVVETRSIGTPPETKIYGVQVLVFTDDSNTGQSVLHSMEYLGEDDIKDAESGYPTIYTTLQIPEFAKVVVIANPLQHGSGASPGVGDSEEYVLEHCFCSGNTAQIAENEGDYMPMSGSFYWADGLVSTVSLYRALAKVVLEYNGTQMPGEQLFEIYEWSIHNCPLSGRIYADPNRVYDMDRVRSEEVYSGLLATGSYGQSAICSDTDPSRAPAAYVPEYNAAKYGGTDASPYYKETADDTFLQERMCIVINTSLGYYRLDFVEKTYENNYNYRWLPIVRNYTYRVNIYAVQSKGYDTEAEALANPPANIEYELVVTNPDMNVVVSNGHYGLELEYDNLVVFSSLIGEDAYEGTIKVNVNGFWGAPNVKNEIIPGYGVSLYSSSLSGEEEEIRFRIPRAQPDGQILFRLGNIEKEVSIHLQPGLDAHSSRETIDIKPFSGGWSVYDWRTVDPHFHIETTNDGLLNISCDENLTPVRWENSQGSGSNESERDAIPIYEPRYAIAYIKPAPDELNPNNGITLFGQHTTKVVIEQTVPQYIGWFGGDYVADIMGAYFKKRLIMESIEEDREDRGSLWGSDISFNNLPTDLNDGLANTKHLLTMGTSDNYMAAWKCWLRNDKNGDGIVSDDEAGENPWYLPAINQVCAIMASSADLVPDYNDGVVGDRMSKYWSSTGTLPTAISPNKVHAVGMFLWTQTSSTLNRYSYLRCVKDL